MKNNLEVVRILNRLINEVETTNVLDDFELVTKYAEEIDSLYSKNIEIPNNPLTPIQPVQPFYPIYPTYPTNPYPYPYPTTDPTQPWKLYDVWCSTPNACAGNNSNMIVGVLNSDQLIESLNKSAKAWESKNINDKKE